MKTAEVDDIVTYFAAIVRAVDSSLLDEWEAMRASMDHAAPEHAPAGREAPGEADVTTNAKALTVLVRNALFSFVRALSRRDYASAASMLEPPTDANDAWTAAKLEAAMAPFWAEHAAIRIDPAARAPSATRVTDGGSGVWTIEQIVHDAEDANDWFVRATMDLAKTRALARPALTLVAIGT